MLFRHQVKNNAQVFNEKGQFVACGGLDNLSTIYSVQSQASVAMLIGHNGWIGCNRFISDDKLVTTSGDCTAALWDIPTQVLVKSFTTSTTKASDAFALRVNPQDPNTFLVGYVVHTTSPNLVLWDTRIDEIVHSWNGDNDINDIA